MTNLITDAWTLADLHAHKIGLSKNGLKVFSAVHCGGGSSMGYKLAGFNVIGGVEIDPRMVKLYRHNLHPNSRYSFETSIQEFKKTIPTELHDIDILDGSPPCSSFSMSGNREKDWTKNRKFTEGQSEQVLDDLFFHFIDVAKVMRPKVVIGENVKGLIIGKARGYVKEIFKAYENAGYDTQLFLLNASRMGVPQLRERTFFISRRKDLNLPKIELNFEEKQIPFSAIDAGIDDDPKLKLTKTGKKWWPYTSPGKSFASVHPKGSLFNWIKVHRDKPLHTLCASSARLSFHHTHPRILSRIEIIRGQSFPTDYDFMDQDPAYVCAMSVPPFMMMRVASAVKNCWF